MNDVFSPSLIVYRPVILKNINAPWLRVSTLGVPLTFPPKRVLAKTGSDDTEGFYLIIKGMVRLSYMSYQGQDKVLCYLTEGTLFNDIPVILGGRPCLFTCMSRVEAIFFKKEDTFSAAFSKQHPELMLNWLESTSVKCSVFFSQLSSVGVHDSFINVCRILCSMYLYQREGDVVVPHISQQDLASLLGIHRGSLHKAFTRLKQEGILEKYSRQRLILRDVQKLFAYAEQ